MYDVETHFYIFTCRYCGHSFKTRFGRKRYCSDLCYTQAHPRKAPRYPRWTHQEIRMLRQLAGEVSPHIIAERLGRTYAAVKTRGRMLNISLICYGERSHSAKHSDALVEQARTLYDKGLRPTEIALQLGIPRRSIQHYVYYTKRLGPPIEYYW